VNPSSKNTHRQCRVIDGGEIQRENWSTSARLPRKRRAFTFNQVNHSNRSFQFDGTTSAMTLPASIKAIRIIDEVPTTGFGDDSPDLYDCKVSKVLRGRKARFRPET